MNNKDLEKKVKSIVHSLQYEKGYVCSVDLFLRLEILSKDDYDSWRNGKIEFLEKACKANLHKLSFINKMLRSNANQLKLEESWTFYGKYGSDTKIKLRFSKSGDERIERLYATHYVNKQRIINLRNN